MKRLWILMACFSAAILLIGCASDPETPVRITKLDKPLRAGEDTGIVLVDKPVKVSDTAEAKKMVDRMIYSERGAHLLDAGKHDQALPEINKALEIDPDFGPALNNRAIIYYLKGEYNKAWEDVTRAEKVGYKVNPKLLHDLRKASGRGK